MNVYLRAFELEDLELIHHWHSNEQINMLTGGNKFFISKERERKWLEDKMLNDSNQIYCAICVTENHKMVGYTSLNKIDLRNRNAFWGGIVIGDQSERNKGFATQAALQLLKYGFFELGLIKISGRWITENKVSIFMAKLLGFKQEGVLRTEIYKNNKFHDVIIMSILKEEFEQLINQIK